jgi:23S rRNA pseudouridine1911/1915/1917 synthase
MRLVVPDELAGQRLDVVIARLAPSLSRRAARRLVEDGAVLVDGKRIQVCSRAMKPGARLEIGDMSGASTIAPEARAAAPAPRLIALDPDVVVVDKDPGVPTEPTREGSRGTLKAALEDLLKERSEDVSFLHAAHRLDTHTTGVVVFARSAEAAHQVGRQLHDGSAERRYLALVAGVPSWQHARLDWSLTRARDGEGKIRVDKEGGVPAVTLATVLVPGRSLALVLCAPRTGRTHQLRVHLAEAGHPLVGDRQYGGKRAPHLGLHAVSLAMLHPKSGEPIRYTAPVPPSFVATAEEGGIPADVLAQIVAHVVTGDVSGDVTGDVSGEEARA